MGLRATLLSDGSSDRLLLPVINWLLRQHQAKQRFETIVWADLRQLRRPPTTFAGRIARSIELFPCEILFIHRDAERESISKRKEEIEDALQIVREKSTEPPPAVCVVPIRMQEAWFLFDEIAIRKAAGNPKGKERLELPTLKKVESLPDPKEKLYVLLKAASGKYGRDLNRFNPAKEVYRVANEIENFEPLRELTAFQSFEHDLVETLQLHFSS